MPNGTIHPAVVSFVDVHQVGYYVTDVFQLSITPLIRQPVRITKTTSSVLKVS